MTCAFTALDAAYVLGSLAPAERAEYERHLATCDECSRAVGELAGMPGLLARVPVDVLEVPVTGEPVPETLLPALVAAAERQQRRRTVRTALLAAAAVAVIAGGSAVVASSLDNDPAPPTSAPSVTVDTTAPPQEMTPVGDGSSTGWVSLTPVPGGTRVDLTCEYQSYGGGHAYTYRVVVISTDGLAHQVTDFTATSGDQVTESGRTALDLNEIEKVVVKNSYGPILTLTPARTR